MTTTYTPRNGIAIIADGDLVDTWGDVVDANMSRLDECLDGMLSLSVSGTVTLTVSTTTTDQSHFAILNVVGGSGGTVVLPLAQGVYHCRNGAAGDVTFTNPAANAVGTVLHSNSISTIINDGVTTCYQIGPGGSLKDYMDNIAASAKAYTDAAALAAASGTLPGQTGNAGKYMQTNGFTANWAQPQISDITGLQVELNQMQAFALVASVLI